MKRILLLVPGAYGEIGGIGLYCRDVAEALAAMPDVDAVTVVPRQVQLALETPPAKVSFLVDAAKGMKDFTRISLKEAWKGADLVICGHIFMLPLAVAVKAITRAPLVLIVYGIDVWEPSRRLADRMLSRCDAIWSISEVTRERMQAWSHLSQSRFRILPNAIHLDRYGMRPPDAGLKQRLGLAGRKIVMTLARLPGADRYKGVDEMLECLPRLLEAEPMLTYVVVGDGPDRGRLEAKARSIGVAERVVFTGYIDEREKADYYRLADAFVMPGRGEGFGFVYLEALACGVPAVGSIMDGSRDALRNGLLGELVDPREPEAIVTATLRALDKPKGIPDGIEHFAWPAFCARIAVAVRELVPLQQKAARAT